MPHPELPSPQRGQSSNENYQHHVTSPGAQVTSVLNAVLWLSMNPFPAGLNSLRAPSGYLTVQNICARDGILVFAAVVTAQ